MFNDIAQLLQPRDKAAISDWCRRISAAGITPCIASYQTLSLDPGWGLGTRPLSLVWVWLRETTQGLSLARHTPQSQGGVWRARLAAPPLVDLNHTKQGHLGHFGFDLTTFGRLCTATPTKRRDIRTEIR